MKTGEDNGHAITLCMGSSCFARGNGDNLEALERWIASGECQARITLAGTRCEGRCAQGPNILIDGNLFAGVTPNVLGDILGIRVKGGVT